LKLVLRYSTISSGVIFDAGLVHARCQWSTPSPPEPLRSTVPFSTTATLAPAFAALIAAWQPAIPPPTMSTSAAEEPVRVKLSGQTAFCGGARRPLRIVLPEIPPWHIIGLSEKLQDPTR